MKALKQYVWLLAGSLMGVWFVAVFFAFVDQTFWSGILLGVLGTLFFVVPLINIK